MANNRQLQSSGSMLVSNHHHQIKSLSDAIDKNLKTPTNFAAKKNDQLLDELFKHLINYAYNENVSDIHIEPQSNYLQVRLRIDGSLMHAFSLSLTISNQLISKIKLIADIDIAQKMLPQDGKILFNHCQESTIDIRVNTCPTVLGEKIALRILPKSGHIKTIKSLRMPKEQEELFIQAISKNQGLILICGPTGSGKTTTLYSALNHLNKQSVNISTIEDPVEILLAGITQVSVNNKSGLSFATCLRAFMRQDPDIIMIGEIRDAETCDIAIRAALTGHLVFATVHANSSIATIERLTNLGVNEKPLITCLNMIVSQRLLKMTCQNCSSNNKDKQCKNCISGYKGRHGVYEILEFTEKYKNQLLARKDGNFLSVTAPDNYITLRQAAQKLIVSNQTDQKEINRVLNIA